MSRERERVSLFLPPGSNGSLISCIKLTMGIGVYSGTVQLTPSNVSDGFVAISSLVTRRKALNTRQMVH
jgi:hypothetical protein